MKIYLSLLLATIMIVAANAQHFNIGAKAGLNIYNLNSDPSFDSDSRIGFHLGLLSHMHLSDHLGLQLEAMYSAQGSKSPVTNGETNLGYINIPLLFQYMFNYGFRIQAGPQVGILISAKDQDDNDFKDEVKSIDFSLALGASYVHVPTGFGVDARYNLGLSDINDNPLSNTKITNSGLQVGVFYLFMHQD